MICIPLDVWREISRKLNTKDFLNFRRVTKYLYNNLHLEKWADLLSLDGISINKRIAKLHPRLRDLCIYGEILDIGKSFTNITKLSLYPEKPGNISETQLCLKYCKKLVSLKLYNFNIGNISYLTQLRKLGLCGCAFDTFDYLPYQSLNSLKLSVQKITQNLDVLTHLDTLIFENCTIPPKSFSRLTNLTKLKIYSRVKFCQPEKQHKYKMEFFPYINGIVEEDINTLTNLRYLTLHCQHNVQNIDYFSKLECLKLEVDFRNIVPPELKTDPLLKNFLEFYSQNSILFLKDPIKTKDLIYPQLGSGLSIKTLTNLQILNIGNEYSYDPIRLKITLPLNYSHCPVFLSYFLLKKIRINEKRLITLEYNDYSIDIPVNQ